MDTTLLLEKKLPGAIALVRRPAGVKSRRQRPPRGVVICLITNGGVPAHESQGAINAPTIPASGASSRRNQIASLDAPTSREMRRAVPPPPALP